MANHSLDVTVTPEEKSIFLNKVYRHSKVKSKHASLWPLALVWPQHKLPIRCPTFISRFDGNTIYDHFNYNPVTAQEHLRSFLEFNYKALNKTPNLKNFVQEFMMINL